MSESGDPALIGRTIAGKFRVEKFLGGGAMGAVYLARQTALEKDVAVKVMHRAVAVDPQFAARFHREAKAASRLDHPNSMRVIDFGEEPDGLLYIAMEYLKGRDLYKVIHEDWPLSNARIADVVMQALAAIAVAHDMGVIHRDLKPENIMVLKGTSDDGHATDVVKVCDFGIAKITEREGDDPAEPPKTAGQKLTTAGLVVGTPEYMSPEQARGEKLDARSDIYSLGIILYQLLTGRVPFTADTALAIVLKHLTDPPEPPQTIYADVHKGLEAVCLKAISKAREDRFQNARDMRAALRAALDGKVLAPPAPHEMNAPTLPLGPGMTTDPSLAPKAVVTSPAMTAPATTAPTVAGVPAITTGGTAITPQKKFPWAALVVAAIVIGGGGTVAAKYGLDHRTPASNHDKPDDPTAHPTTKPDAPVPTGPTTAKITPEPTDTTPAPTIDKNGKKIPPPTTKKNEKNGTVLATTAEPPTAGTTAPPPPTTAAPPTETTPPPPPPPTVTTPPPPPPPVAFDPATCRAVAGPVSASGSTNKGDLNANGVPQSWGSCARNLKERLGGPVSAKVVVRFSDSRQFRGATCEGCPPAAAACVTGSASKMSVTFRGGDVTGDPTFVIPLTFSCD